jgi:hypothetical protein
MGSFCGQRCHAPTQDEWTAPGAGTTLNKRSSGSPPRGGPDKKSSVKTNKQNQTPGWASGLRQLYDSVAHEPLPDTLKDLLSKLDAKS